MGLPILAPRDLSVELHASWYRVASKKCPSIRRVLVSGVWVEMTTFICFPKLGGLMRWDYCKAKKVDKVGFAVHRASFVFS